MLLKLEEAGFPSPNMQLQLDVISLKAGPSHDALEQSHCFLKLAIRFHALHDFVRERQNLIDAVNTVWSGMQKNPDRPQEYRDLYNDICLH